MPSPLPLWAARAHPTTASLTRSCDIVRGHVKPMAGHRRNFHIIEIHASKFLKPARNFWSDVSKCLRTGFCCPIFPKYIRKMVVICEWFIQQALGCRMTLHRKEKSNIRLISYWSKNYINVQFYFPHTLTHLSINSFSAMMHFTLSFQLNPLQNGPWFLQLFDMIASTPLCNRQ